MTPNKMLPPRTRKEFRDLAQMRLKEARVLLGKRKYSGAYYLCGYVIECGLKACIARNTRRSTFPEKNFVTRCWTHDLKELIDLSELKVKKEHMMRADPNFAANWGVVKDWDESARYIKTSWKAARDMVNAVADPRHGVLQWIERYW